MGIMTKSSLQRQFGQQRDEGAGRGAKAPRRGGIFGEATDSVDRKQTGAGICMYRIWKHAIDKCKLLAKAQAHLEGSSYRSASNNDGLSSSLQSFWHVHGNGCLALHAGSGQHQPLSTLSHDNLPGSG